MDLQLKGKTALVLAASKGLGKASALALSKEGANVVIGARDIKTLEATAEDIRRQTGGQIIAIPTDVNNPVDAANTIQKTVDSFGSLDILVNNAGGPPFGKFESFDETAWQSAFDGNLLSVVRFCRLAIPHLKASGNGRIINIISLSVKTFLADSVLSTSMRMGVVGMAKLLSNELGPDHITVNNVAPGLILTDRVKDTLPKNPPPGATVESMLAEKAKDIPVRRIGKPEELAALVTFLASPLAGYITGATIPIDGGAVRSTM